MNANLDVLSHRMQAVHEDVSEMKAVLRDLSAAVTKLALVEERQSRMVEDQRRQDARIEAAEGRIHTLEQAAPISRQANVWVFQSLWFAGAMVMAFLAKKAGLL